MATGQEAGSALKGIEAQLIEGGVVDFAIIMADIERVQQNFDERLDKVDLN